MHKHRKRVVDRWKLYAERDQREQAVLWLIQVRNFSRRTAESCIANYLKNEAPRK